MTAFPCIACGTCDDHSRFSPWCTDCAHLPLAERTELWMQHIWCPEQEKPDEQAMVA